MIKDQATPRPWKLYDELTIVDPNKFDKYGNPLVIVKIKAHTSDPFCEDANGQEAKANARLIFKAVNRDHLFNELLEVCKAALKYNQRIEGHAWKGANYAEDNNLDELYEDWINKSKQALQKAEAL